MFLIWLGALAIAAHVIYHGAWHPSLAVANPHQHFFLALFAGAAQARLCGLTASSLPAALWTLFARATHACMHAVRPPIISSSL
jgi:hypothetical protein